MESKKTYLCKLPTNGYQPGDIVELTDVEVANFNGGEDIPRFVSTEEAATAEVPEVTTPTPEGEYKEEEETTPSAEVAPEGEVSAPAETTTPSAEGVE